MNKLKNWTEVMEGIYRYPISEHSWYELQLMYHARSTNILMANAQLYKVNNSDSDFFQRTFLFDGAVFKCLDKAADDFQKEEK